MKKILRLSLVLLVIFSVIFVGLYIFVNLKGKDIIMAQLKKQLDKEVFISDVSLRPPLNLGIRNLEIKGLLKVDYLSASPSLIGALFGRPVINRLYILRPEITLERNPDGKIALPIKTNVKAGSNQDNQNNGKRPKIMILSRLIIRDGRFIFKDKRVSPEGFPVVIDNIKFNISRLSFPPLSLATKFKLDATVPMRENSPEGIVKFQGWMDLYKKDMEAELDVSGIDGMYFLPYFKNLVSSSLKSADMRLKSVINSEDNNLTADCHLEIKNLEFAEEATGTAEERQILSPFAIIFSNLVPSTKQVTLDFPIEGKLYPFAIERVKLTGRVTPQIIQKGILDEPEKLPKKIEKIGEQFKGLKDELEGIFKERKEEKEEQNQE